jgi:hypothetical protein
MPGMPRELIEHSLNVHPQQRLRRFAHDKREAIKREIAKLLAAGFIKEVIHLEWVANPILVRKKNNKWRMCVDYTELNKHCPKDHFGLPRIDQVVDSTAGCVLLCFRDCYSGYHQIALKEEDQIKTAFITPFGTYAYKTMSFGLKNVGVTYQRAIQMCFADQLHWNVKAYVDDVVIKTRNPDGLIADLEETFSSLRRFRWKLNPTKCIFGVPSGKLLGFIVSNRGIEANPVKISAITDMGAEANRMYGSPEQVHLPARGERTALLQAPKAPRQVPVDRGGRASLARPEASPSVSSSPYSTIAGRRSTTLHYGNNSCC